MGGVASALTALVDMLTRRAHHVLTASSLAEARAVANAEFSNLIISDLGLPDGTGVELMAELKKRRMVNGIALTGYGMAEDIARSRKAGFVVHLTKPVRAQSLEAAIRTATQPNHTQTRRDRGEPAPYAISK